MFSTTESAKATMDLRVCQTRNDLGKQAATDIAEAIREGLRRKPLLRMIFAAAPSQGEMLQALLEEPNIDWGRISAFHMDEYLGLAVEAPQSFGSWLRRAIFDRVPFASVHLIQSGEDLDQTCREYARKLSEAPIDLVLLGVGTNGHLAFNDPPADLNDPLPVKVVELDELCRQQQVDDKCFAAIADVPRHAITLTVPALLRGDRLFGCIPGTSKSTAVRRMVHDPISGVCPATALRRHPRCTIYLDRDSSALLGDRS